MTRRLTDGEREENERDQIEDRLDRDRRREPRFTPRARLDLRARGAFQAGVLDTVNRVLTAKPAVPVPIVVDRECPLCKGTVYSVSDSEGERIDCSWCGAVLTTRLDIDGVSVVELDAGVSAPDRPPMPTSRVAAAIANLGREQEPARGWEARVLAAVAKRGAR